MKFQIKTMNAWRRISARYKRLDQTDYFNRRLSTLADWAAKALIKYCRGEHVQDETYAFNINRMSFYCIKELQRRFGRIESGDDESRIIDLEHAAWDHFLNASERNRLRNEIEPGTVIPVPNMATAVDYGIKSQLWDIEYRIELLEEKREFLRRFA